MKQLRILIMSKISVKIIFALTVFLSFQAYAEINIAVVAPTSGDFRVFGRELVWGAEVAVNEINAGGGLQGKKVNLIKIDDPCDDVLSLTTAEMISLNKTDEKVYMVIGPYCSNQSEKIADIYAKSEIIQILPLPVSAKSYPNSYKGMVKFVGYKEQQAKDFAQYFQNRYHKQNLAVIYDNNNNDNSAIAEALKKEFFGDNLGKTEFFTYDGYANELDKIGADVLSSDIKYAYIIGSPNQILEMSKFLQNNSSNFVIFTNRYQAKANFNKRIGDNATNINLLSLPNLKDSPNFVENLVNLRLLGIEPEGLMAYSYLSIKFWQKLIISSNSFAYNDICKRVNDKKTHQTGWGEIIFNNGTPQKSIGYCIYNLKYGEYTQVY